MLAVMIRVAGSRVNAVTAGDAAGALAGAYTWDRLSIQGNNMQDDRDARARSDDISSVSSNDYGASYEADSAAIYVAYVRFADAVADRRQRANGFGFTVNSGLVGLSAYLEHLGVALTPVVALAGMVLTLAWHRQIGGYRLVSRAKFEVIEAMEKHLPLRPYAMEWQRMSAGADPRRYRSLSRIEESVPLVFFALHLVALVASVLHLTG